MGAVMPWKNPLYFLVTATLAASQLCYGQAADSEAAVQRTSSPGSLHFRSVVSGGKHESAAPTRHGSLTFKWDEHGDQSSSSVLHNLMAAKLRRMDPSVQCSDNLMTLKVKRVRAPHFLVDSGEGPLTPLSQMPSKCGFSVRRSRRDVHFVAPYHGCKVIQQGGNYVLPLRLWGAPMTMSCPAVLPPPSVSCFPSGMVVKISGITANELKVKVSGMWTSLSSVCRSCGFAVEVCSGGLTLTAPYNRGLCTVTKDEKYLLSLLLADVELLVTCPSLPDIKPTTATTTPPRDSGPVLQYPQYPQFPVFPGPTTSTHTAAPTTGPVAPLPQRPQLPSGAATDSNTENQQAPAALHPAFPFMPPYPQFPQYPLFPRPVPPTQSTANTDTAAPPAQLPQMPLSPQYPFPFFPQFPMAPGNFLPANPPPVTSTEALVTTPAPTTRHDGMPNVLQQPQFPMFPQYPVFPGPTTPTHTAAPTTGPVAPLPQCPQPPSGAATDSNTENQQAPAALHPAFPFMPPYPQFPQYPLFPRPVPPTQSTANTDTAAPPAQLPQMPLSPQYPFPFFPQFPMAPGNFLPATPPPVTSTEALVTTPAPTTKHDGMPNVLQQPQFPMFPQYPVFPGPTTSTHTAAPTTGPVAPLPQRPQLPSGAATDSNTENQQAPAAPHPAFPFMPPYPQFPQYPLFPRPVPPTQSTANTDTAAPPAQLPQMPLSPQYPFPFFPQFPMAPGNFLPANPPPVTSTEALVTTPAPTSKHDGMPNVAQWPQFPMHRHYNFLSFPKPEDQTEAFQEPKPVNQKPKPHHVYPKTYQIPVLYPPPKYPAQRQNTQTAAPATTSTTSATTTLNPAAQMPFYYPHPYMPHYVLQQAPMPVFPDSPSDQHERQPVYRAMPQFYPFPSHQWPNRLQDTGKGSADGPWDHHRLSFNLTDV